jgi:hypothetical protein
MADRLNVTELDFDTIKTNLKTFLKSQSEFQDYDFEGSGLNVLLDILAYNTHYNAYYLNMIANESFMDSAVLRNSVVSHAKRIGYTPRSVAAPRAIVNVVVDTGTGGTGTLTLPKNYVFISNQIDGKAYNFITLSSQIATKSGNTFTFNSVPIYEGEYVTYSYTHNELSNPKQIFSIPDTNVDTSTLAVSVRPSLANTDVTVHTLSSNDLNLSSTSEVYFLQEGQNGNYEVFFGDGILGKKLNDGAIVTLEYLITSGEASNKANNFIGSTNIGGYTNVNVVSLSGASGGTVRETVDQIKFAAPLSLLAQNRAVTKNDYIRLIQQKYPAFDAVNVWGGEEQDPPVYGKVFVAAKPKLGFEVTQTEKEYVKQNILKPISVLTVAPEIVDVDYNYLTVDATIYYNKAKTSLTDNQIKNAVRNLITTYSTTNLNKFNTYFNYTGLEALIYNYDKSFISDEVDLYVAKKFRPVLTNSDSYTLDFGFEISRGVNTNNFYSSPDFTMVDENGVSRQCFFEEIPSSYTGLESVTVTNMGYGYTTTPTIEIIGDGEGATAVATIINGKLSKIDVTSPGIGYTTAAIRIIGGGGQLASATAVLEGRYGQLRIAYYKTDEISSQSTKVIINQSKNGGVAGTIDYVLGKIVITEFAPIAVNNDFGDILMHFKPASNIIQSKLNKMLVLDAEDPTSIIVKTVQV